MDLSLQERLIKVDRLVQQQLESKGGLTKYSRNQAKELVEDVAIRLTNEVDADAAMRTLGWARLSELGTVSPQRASQLMDEFHIPQYLASAFARAWGLQGFTSYSVKKVRTEHEARITIEWDEETRSCTRGLLDALTELLTPHIHANEAKGSVVIKFAFDGGQWTTTQRKSFQIGTVSAPEFGSMAENFSPDGAVVIWAMDGKEATETYLPGLESLAKQINDILKSRTVEIANHKLDLTIHVVLDLKSLCMMLGLSNVYNPNSEYCCPFCHAVRGKLHLKREYSKRTTTEVMEYSRRAGEDGPLTPKNNLGYSSRAVLDLDGLQEDIISFFTPDLLHMEKSVPEKCLGLTIASVGQHEHDIHEQMVAFFRDKCKVYVHPSVKIGQKQSKVIQDRVEKALWRRDNWMRLMSEADDLVSILQRAEHFQQQPQELERVRRMWILVREMFQMLNVDRNDENAVAEFAWSLNRAEYDKRADELRNILSIKWKDSAFTTYMHIFLDHVGELIERGHNFARLANFNIEAKHAVERQRHRGAMGQPTIAKSVVVRDSLARVTGKRLRQIPFTQRRDEAARRHLVGKKRGRPQNANKKPPLHTLLKLH